MVELGLRWPSPHRMHPLPFRRGCGGGRCDRQRLNFGRCVQRLARPCGLWSGRLHILPGAQRSISIEARAGSIKTRQESSVVLRGWKPQIDRKKTVRPRVPVASSIRALHPALLRARPRGAKVYSFYARDSFSHVPNPPPAPESVCFFSFFLFHAYT